MKPKPPVADVALLDLSNLPESPAKGSSSIALLDLTHLPESPEKVSTSIALLDLTHLPESPAKASTPFPSQAKMPPFSFSSKDKTMDEFVVSFAEDYNSVAQDTGDPKPRPKGGFSADNLKLTAVPGDRSRPATSPEKRKHNVLKLNPKPKDDSESDDCSITSSILDNPFFTKRAKHDESASDEEEASIIGDDPSSDYSESN